MACHKRAAEVANWHTPKKLWLDHAHVGEDDLDWMAPVESLVLWNVRMPDGLLAQLPNLRGISLRGGSSTGLQALDGCDALLSVVNQVRGIHDVGALAEVRSLEFLSLYGLPRVEELPSLHGLEALRHVQLGSMKGLKTLAGVASIPNLNTLQSIRAVNVTADDIDMLVEHPALEAFDWFAEDVPRRVVEPVIERLSHLRRPAAVRPEDWLADRLQAK